MAAIIYSLCALTSLACAVMLLRAWAATRTRILLWSGLCFVGLTANNVILVLDRVVYPDLPLGSLRLALAFFALLLLLFGLVWEKD